MTGMEASHRAVVRLVGDFEALSAGKRYGSRVAAGQQALSSMGGQHDWRDDPLPNPEWMRWRGAPAQSSRTGSLVRTL
jgi:hypothetical protein